jgi:hypothetical protein
MKNILVAEILILLMGSVSAYTIDFNVIGRYEPPYPMLFFNCNGDCSNVYVNYTARNHTALPAKVSDKDMLFLELSGLPSTTTEAMPILIEFTQSEGVIYHEYPLNLPYVDFTTSTTISIDFNIPVSTTTTTLQQERFKFFDWSDYYVGRILAQLHL